MGQLGALLLGIAFTLHQATAAPQSVLVQELKQLVEINSGTKNVKGVAEVQRRVAAKLKSLGFDVQIDANDFLVGTLKGEDPRTIILLVHADTVFEPSANFNQFTISADGLTATGPGVIDDKGGIVIALEGLSRFLKSEKSKYTLKFVSSPAEETGSPALLEAFRQLAQEAWMVLAFEPALDDGSIVKSRRGLRWYQVNVNGKEAHAGRAHKDGINACHDLSAKLNEISRLTDYKKNVTVSIGRMEGGQDKFNIVCGSATAKIDARFADLRTRDALHRNIERILKKTHARGAQASYEIVDDAAPMHTRKETEPYIKKYLSHIKAVEGKEVQAGQSNGTAEINYFGESKALAIDGLGAVGGKMHTKEEFIVLSSLESRAEALARFLKELHR